MNQEILDKLVKEAEEKNIKAAASKLTKTQKDEPKKTKSKKTSSTKTSYNASTMEELLQDNTIDFPQEGDTLEGTVVDISSVSVLVDLGILGVGIALGKEAKDGMRENQKLKVGDKVSATLLDIENEDGQIEISIREASYEKAWEDLEEKKNSKETLKTRVLEANKGGLMVELNGISGFLPVSQLSSEHYPRVEDGNKNKILEKLKKLFGKELYVRLIDIDRENEKLIVSEKEACSDKEKESISELRKGDTISGTVSGVVDFGAFVKFYPPSKKDSTDESDRLEGLVHISELAWQLIDNPRKVVRTGNKVQAKIIDINEKRISLSIKALLSDPWHNIFKKYKVDNIVKGKVDKINPFGAFVYLDDDIHGLAHVSEFKEAFPEKRMDEILQIGKTFKWKILSIEPDEHRMGLLYVEEDPVKSLRSHGAGEEEKKDQKKSAKKGKKDDNKDSKESRKDKPKKVKKEEKKPTKDKKPKKEKPKKPKSKEIKERRKRKNNMIN